MAEAALDLKVVVSVVQESKESLQQALEGLRGILTAIQGIDKASLSNVVAQLSKFAETVKSTGKIGDIGVGIDPSGVGSLSKEIESVKPNLDDLHTHVEKVNEATKSLGKDNGLQELEKGLDDTGLSFRNLERAVAGFFTTFREGLTLFLEYKAVEFTKELADEAANVQLLGDSLSLVGKNAGYSQEELDKTIEEIEKYGITTQIAERTTARFIQAGLGIEKIPEIAKLAANGAALMGTSFDEAFQFVERGIESGYPRMLRFQGIVVDQKEAFDKYADSVHKTTGELDQQERAVAVLNAVSDLATTRANILQAAQGDVALQLKFFPAYIEKIKESVGAGLLPAYAAVVAQVTLFLKDLQLISKEGESQTAFAKGLGSAFGTIASAVRIVAEEVIKYRTVIFDLIAAYAILKFANSEIVDGLYKIIVSFGETETAGSALAVVLDVLAGKLTLVEGASALAGGLSIVAAAITSLLVAFTALGVSYAATGSTQSILGEKLGKLGDQYIAFIAGPIAGVLKALYELGRIAIVEVESGFEVLKSLVTGDWSALPKIWDDFRTHLKAAWDDLKGFLVDWTKLVGGEKPADVEEASKPLGNIDEATEKLIDAQKRQYKAQQDLQNLQKQAASGLSGAGGTFATPKEIEAASKKLEEVTKETNEAGDAYNRIVNSGTVDAATIKKKSGEVSDAYQQIIKDGVQDAADKTQDDIKELFGNKFVIDPKLGLIGGSFKKTFDDFGRTIKDASVGTLVLKKGLEELAKTTNTADALKHLTEAVNDYNVKTKNTDTQFGKQVLQVGKQNVIDENKSFLAKSVEEEKSNAKALGESRTESLKNELTIVKTTNQYLEEVDKEKYKKGLLSLEEYYSNRESRIKEAASKEFDVEKQTAVNTLEQVKFSTSVSQTADLRNKLQESLDKIQQSTGNVPITVPIKLDTKGISEFKKQIQSIQVGFGGENEVKLQANTLQKSQELQSIAEQIKQLNSQSDIYLEGESGKVEEITKKYDELSKKLHATGDASASAAIALARDIDLVKASIDAANKSLESSIALQKSIIDLDKARIDSQEKHGAIGPVEAQNARNDLVQQELNVIKQQIDADTRQLQTYEKLRNEALSLGKDTTGVDEDIQKVIKDIDSLNKELITTSDQITTYGQQLQKGFTEGLSTAIGSSITNLQKAGNSFIQLAQSLRKQVADILGKEISTKIVTSLVNSTSEKDENGKPIKGTSPFDFLGKLLGDKSKRGESQANPLWVKNADGTLKLDENGKPIYAPNAGEPQPEKSGSIFDFFKKKQKPVEGTPDAEGVYGTREKVETIPSVLPNQDIEHNLITSAAKEPKILGDTESNPIYAKVTNLPVKTGGEVSKGGTTEVPSSPVPPSLGQVSGKIPGVEVAGGNSVAALSGELDNLLSPKISSSPEGASTPNEVIATAQVPTTTSQLPDVLQGSSAPGPDYNQDVAGGSLVPVNATPPVSIIPQVATPKVPNTVAPGSQAPAKSVANAQSSAATLKQREQIAQNLAESQIGKGAWLRTLNEGISAAFSIYSGIKSNTPAVTPSAGDISALQQQPFDLSTFQGIVGQKEGGPIGKVSGPGTGTSDSIPTALSDGEYVMTAVKTQKWLPVLEGIRSGAIDDSRMPEVQSIANGTRSLLNYAFGGLIENDAQKYKGMPEEPPSYSQGGYIKTEDNYTEFDGVTPVAPRYYKKGGIVNSVLNTIVKLATGGQVSIGDPSHYLPYAESGEVNVLSGSKPVVSNTVPFAGGGEVERPAFNPPNPRPLDFIQRIASFAKGGLVSGFDFVKMAVGGVLNNPKGKINGPGTGTSDSISAKLSAGEHVMTAAKTKVWLPLLEGIRLGYIDDSKFPSLNAIASGTRKYITQSNQILNFDSSRIYKTEPRESLNFDSNRITRNDSNILNLASGGLVGDSFDFSKLGNGGSSGVDSSVLNNAASVRGYPTNPDALMIQLHPDALHMTMKDWLDHEVARTMGRR